MSAAKWTGAAVGAAVVAGLLSYGIQHDRPFQTVDKTAATARPSGSPTTSSTPTTTPSTSIPSLTSTQNIVTIPRHSLSFKDGSTYGMGMIVSLKFAKPVPNQKEVRQAVKVTSDSGQEVRAHWFSTTRLDFRSEAYWIAGSTVTVEGLGGKPLKFKVGRQQIATVDAATHTMTVKRDGRVIKTVSVTAGRSANPTYNGDMVITEKFAQVRMDASTVGIVGEDGKPAYDIPDVPHAMRLSQSGTFIHGNYWKKKSVFGTQNTSAGCVGLFDVKPDETGKASADTEGKWFYESSMIGDVVRVMNSPDKVIKPDNGLNSWNLDWSQWVK